jgi:steroid delta-isomerase-like uncharacterized protein
MAGIVLAGVLPWACRTLLKERRPSMSESENEKITQDTFAAWNAHDAERYVEFISDDYVWESDAFPFPIRGREAVKTVMQMYFAAFPDIQFEIETTVASGNFVAKAWIATGTHKGEFLGVPATNKRVSLRGCTMIELKDGKIVKSTAYSDRMALMQQLGAMKSAAAAS